MGKTQNDQTSLKPGFGVYAYIQGKGYFVSLVNGKISVCQFEGTKYKTGELVKWLEEYMAKSRTKLIALGLFGLEDPEKLRSTLWLKLDIVTHLLDGKQIKGKEGLKRACWQIERNYTKDNMVRVKMSAKRRVIPSFLTGLDRYKAFATKKEFERIRNLADDFRKNRMSMIFINATAAGGGVAHMRHAMLRLYGLLGVDVGWYVLKPDNEIFNITKKKFHNVLQAVAPANCVLNKNDKIIYNKWIKENVGIMEDAVRRSRVVVIDDPQPAGLIPHIRKINPRAKVFYRSHIQIRADLIDNRSVQQFKTWNFLWQFIKLADVFVSHPVPDFVPKTVKEKKLVYMPPSTDPLDGLNKRLSKRQKEYYVEIFNKHLRDNGQAPLDPRRPYFIQIARFDPSKGIFDVLDSYRRLRRRLAERSCPLRKTPQLVIVGNGSIDDPEGVSIYEETRQNLTLDTYLKIADDIKVARLPHYDQLLNTLLDNSLAAFQLSHKEGFEFKVTEALMKGRPVIAYRSGGIPLQIRHGKTGYLVDAGRTKQVADHSLELLQDNGSYKKMGALAVKTINHDYWTLNNCAKWLYLVQKATEQGNKKGQESINEALLKYFA